MRKMLTGIVAAAVMAGCNSSLVEKVCPPAFLKGEEPQYMSHVIATINEEPKKDVVLTNKGPVLGNRDLFNNAPYSFEATNTAGFFYKGKITDSGIVYEDEPTELYRQANGCWEEKQ